MTTRVSQYEYEPTGHGINKFHAWLMKHPKIHGFSSQVWEILFHGLRMGETIHWGDARKNDKRPYIHHQVEIIINYIESTEVQQINPNDILVYALHDAIEDHPEIWKMILEKFGLQIFRDVLVLATAGIPLGIRKEILEYVTPIVSDKTEFIKELKNEQDIYLDIMRIASPANPIFKLDNQSHYSDVDEVQGYQKIKQAIELYAKMIISQKHKIKSCTVDMDENMEYIGLGNYLYFTAIDARRKLHDMLDNMKDMKQMEKIRPGYTDTRRIKAYILGVKLKHFGMGDEYAQLTQAFIDMDTTMPSDAEVYEKIGAHTH